MSIEWVIIIVLVLIIVGLLLWISELYFKNNVLKYVVKWQKHSINRLEGKE